MSNTLISRAMRKIAKNRWANATPEAREKHMKKMRAAKARKRRSVDSARKA